MLHYDVSTLALSDGQKISSWSSTGNLTWNFVQATDANRPTYKTNVTPIGGPAILFNPGESTIPHFLHLGSNYPFITNAYNGCTIVVATIPIYYNNTDHRILVDFGIWTNASIGFSVGCAPALVYCHAPNTTHTQVKPSRLDDVNVTIYRLKFNDSMEVWYNGTRRAKTVTPLTQLTASEISGSNPTRFASGGPFCLGTMCKTGGESSHRFYYGYVMEFIMYQQAIEYKNIIGISNYLYSKYTNR